MNFPVIWTAYAIIGCAAVIAITLLIINLVQVGHANSELEQLRDEMEKRAREMDALRRSQSATTPSSDLRYQPIYEAPASIPVADQPQTAYSSAPESGGIEVTRNVRGSMDDIGSSHLQHQTLPTHHAAEEPTPEPPVTIEVPPEPEPVAPVSEPITPVPPVTTEVPQPTPPSAFIAPPLPETEAESLAIVEADPDPAPDEVLDVVDESESSGQSGPIVLPLYSASKKDADFTALWDSFKSVLDTTTGATIYINMADVLFVYEREAGYLERIAAIASQKECTLGLIGLSDELTAQIAVWPNLAALVLKV